MKLKYLFITVLCMLIVFASGCGRSSPSPGSRSALDDLKELGFYVVTSGKTKHVSFREYGSGSTQWQLPVADFPDIPALGTGDYFLLYGDMPEGPLGTGVMVFPYEIAGDFYEHSGNDVSIESFFSLEPLDPVRDQKVTKLVPKATVAPGLYFLHKYVGLEGDAYLAFQLGR